MQGTQYRSKNSHRVDWMKFLERLFPKKQAAAPIMSGSPVMRQRFSLGYVDRSVVVSPERIAANRSIPVVLESLSGLSRLCFTGFDHVLKPLDPSDDTQEANIKKALQQIHIQEKRIGRIGKSRRNGTLGLVRATALDGWSFRQAVAEYSTIQEGNWQNFAEIQLLPAQSFGTAPGNLPYSSCIADKILPGIVYDINQDLTRFFQAGDNALPRELDPDNIIYIEDITIPDDLSFMKVLNPTIEAWKEVRRYGMLAEHRVGVPDEVASINARDVVAMIEAKIPVKMQDLIDHCDDLAERQSHESKKVALAGTKIEYPKIDMPLNPWDADQYLKEEICDFFFKRNVIKRVEQAVSSSDSGAKALIDIHVSSERELWGKPFESLWNTWLEWNGFELVDEFAWWDWSPEDQDKQHKRNLENFRSHAMTIQTFCELEGLPIPNDEELQEIAAQHALLFGKDNVLSRSNLTV